MKALKVVGIIMVFASSTFAADLCPNEDYLAVLGWKIHSESEFDEVYAKTELLLKSEDVVDDLHTSFDSETLEKTVYFRSWDSLSTYDMEMYGDYVYYSDVEGGRPFEIRWYEGGVKHLVRQGTKCTCDDVPLADNTLF